MTDTTDERMRSVRRDLTTLEDDLIRLRREKADVADVEAVSKKQGQMEADILSKVNSIAAALDELRHILTIRNEHGSGKVQPATTAPSGTHKTSDDGWMSKVPPWGWLLMGMGALAFLQAGLQQMAAFGMQMPGSGG